MQSPDWLPPAQALPEGHTTKIGHDCGPGECLQLNHRQEGWSAYCHRCGYKWFQPRPAESLAERLERFARTQTAEDAAKAVRALPRPCVTDTGAWPSPARAWLYKAGLSNFDIARLGIYWNPILERVVIPIRDTQGTLLYWQARTLDPSNPRKYLNPNVDKRTLVAKFGAGGQRPVLVLTEDLLSAYRVAGAGYEAWSLLGTKMNDCIAAQVLRTAQRVITWLDPDDAGQNGAAEIRRHMRVYGRRVENIVSHKDPKLLSRKEIECLVTPR